MFIIASWQRCCTAILIGKMDGFFLMDLSAYVVARWTLRPAVILQVTLISSTGMLTVMTSSLQVEVASPNDIHNSELRYHFWSGSAILTAAPLYVKPTPTVEISANSLTTHIKLKCFCSFQFCWSEQSFWKNSTCFFVFWPLFTNFTGLVSYMQPLSWEKSFLGRRFWLYLPPKQSLLWKPARAQDIARECHSSTVIFCWNLLCSHYDYQRTSTGLGNKHSTPDTWVVEAVYWHKNCMCWCVWQRVCSCIIELKRAWNPQL